MAHIFYFGLHPVSWFIIFMNVGITIFEWRFLVSRFFALRAEKAETDAKKQSASWCSTEKMILLSEVLSRLVVDKKHLW